MEFDQHTPHPVIFLMREWFDYKNNASSDVMKHPIWEGPCGWGPILASSNPTALRHQAYQMPEISERHRHRYEFNNEYREVLAENGMRFTGLSPDRNLVEIIELADHPWFLGCQFHPEFKSRPMDPHPLFKAFVAQALERARAKS